MTTIWKKNIDLVQLNSFRAAGLGELLGIKIAARGKNWLTAEMPVSDNHKQPLGIVHGGATASLAETVASIAAWLCVEAEDQTAVGLELNINHLKPTTKGVLMARATAIHVGKRTQVWQIDIYNDKAIQVSSARLTVAVVSTK
jgi:uncharacterized protein (TIGR00369 family)